MLIGQSLPEAGSSKQQQRSCLNWVHRRYLTLIKHALTKFYAVFKCDITELAKLTVSTSFPIQRSCFCSCSVRRLRPGHLHWCDTFGCAAVVVYRHFAEARADLKHSVLSESTVLLSKWFQVKTVLGKKECLYCSVLSCIAIRRFESHGASGVLDTSSVDLLDLIRRPCFWGVKNVSAGLASTSPLTTLYQKVRRCYLCGSRRVGRYCLWRRLIVHG